MSHRARPARTGGNRPPRHEAPSGRKSARALVSLHAHLNPNLIATPPRRPNIEIRVEASQSRFPSLSPAWLPRGRTLMTAGAPIASHAVPGGRRSQGMTKVLLIEDDDQTADEIVAELVHRGFPVERAATRTQGLEKTR